MKLDISEIKFGGNKNFSMKNEITFNSEICTHAFQENELVEVCCSNKIKFATVSYQNKQSKDVAYLSNDLKDFICTEIFTINKINHVAVKQYLTAKILNVQQHKVEISKNLIDKLLIENQKSDLILINNFNGYRLDLSKKDYVIDETKDDIIRLGVKHRRLLDVELPTFINSYYLDTLGNDIKKYYHSELKNVIYDDYYNAVSEFKKIYQSSDINILTIYSIPNNEKQSLTKTIKNYIAKGIINKILECIIGQRKISLRVVRPCPIDESENTIRISEVTMKLLGLDETDNVIVRNGKYSIKAKVMKIDKYASIAQENRLKSEQELDIIIGIPAYMRVKLDLSYINSTVTIERDLHYLFRKNLNNQIMTIIGFLVSLSFIDFISNVFIKSILLLIIMISLVYLSFSQIREKVGRN